MATFVTDTHALVWHLVDQSSLSPKARAIFQSADLGRDSILVPSISIVEMIYLAERFRIPREVLDRTLNLARTPSGSYRVVPLDADVAAKVAEVPRNVVPDMPDRIISATAHVYRVPVITRDSRIGAQAAVEAVW
jgi:PIN domain nuclease of toxin-antitoxin system